MADKLYAFTDIDHNGEKIPHGTEIDRSKFTKEQLIALVEAGAVSKFNRLEVEQPEITVEEILAETTESAPEPTATKPKP